MKKLSVFFMFMAFTFIMPAAHAQYIILEDLTSMIINPDFTADSPVSTTVYTYDYNMTDAGAGADGNSLFGMQPVTGWIANAPSNNIKVMQSSSDTEREDGANARASGIFAYGNTSCGLGGNYYAPNASNETTQQALGLVSVWGGQVQYTQEITLPAGGYMLIAKVCNTTGGTLSGNKIGFVAETGTEYLSLRGDQYYNVYTAQKWENDTIIIQLETTTKGNLSLGFTYYSGSSSAPHLFIDNVRLYSIDMEARGKLYDLIQMGIYYGIDVTDQQTVYEDNNSKIEQVEAAIEKLRSIIVSDIKDVTDYFINNPHFTEDTPIEGGVCTYDYDCEANNVAQTNYGMQSVNGWIADALQDNGRASGVCEVGSKAFLGGPDYIVPNTMPDGSTEGKLVGYVACWSSTVLYYQETTLPAGKYILKASYYNAGGTQSVSDNLLGFIADEGYEDGYLKQKRYLSTATAYTVGNWVTEEIAFELSKQTNGKIYSVW